MGPVVMRIEIALLGLGISVDIVLWGQVNRQDCQKLDLLVKLVVCQGSSKEFFGLNLSVIIDIKSFFVGL
jgi:hypothetical protein